MHGKSSLVVMQQSANFEGYQLLEENPKNSDGDMTSSENCRGISLSPVISKF